MTIDSLTVANIGIGTIIFLLFVLKFHEAKERRQNRYDAFVETTFLFLSVILILLVIKSINSVLLLLLKPAGQSCSLSSVCGRIVSWPFSSENSLNKIPTWWRPDYRPIFLTLGIYLFGILFFVLNFVADNETRGFPPVGSLLSWPGLILIEAFDAPATPSAKPARRASAATPKPHWQVPIDLPDDDLHSLVMDT